MAVSEPSGPGYASARESALLDRAFTRAAGAPLVNGNSVRLLKNAAENYPAWLEAIHSARTKIYFENYFICDDRIGREFAAALAERARGGVRVCLVHDWLGSVNKASRRFWRSLTDAGVEVRTFNPLKPISPMDVLHRDHRKVLAVDGQVGFVTGLCVGDMWVGDAARGIEPWRDTGIEVRGPALCDIERAFAHVWDAIGEPLAAHEVVAREALAETGDVSLRIVANEPGTTGIFRLDQLIAAAARSTLWLTDAYFAGIAPYVQALRAAAADGVDVRLLVPGSSDIPVLKPLSQAGFRPLLEAGIRVFEWKGSMLHAKTAVADGRWARVGSSNLNVASWIGNYELDAVVENEDFAAEMEDMYLADLENATEIVLEPRRRRVADRAALRGTIGGVIKPRGSASRAAAGALRIGRTVSAALSEQRVLARTDARLVATSGIVSLGIATVGVFWPLVIIVPLAIVLGWVGLVLLIRAFTLRRERRSQGLPTTRVRPAPVDASAPTRMPPPPERDRIKAQG
ncbi:MAG: phospholipase D-like domain-containing protein [Gammaproteobacteria bacterium]